MRETMKNDHEVLIMNCNYKGKRRSLKNLSKSRDKNQWAVDKELDMY